MTSTIHTSGSPPEQVRTVLGREHERLASLFREVVDAFESGSQEGAAVRFNELERTLEAHLQMEEEHILPGLARVDPQEAKTLREEHDRIRALVASLGVGLDLHATRASAIVDLVKTLEAHAKREDTLAYRWAEANLDEPTRAKLRVRVSDRLAHLAARLKLPGASTV